MVKGISRQVIVVRSPDQKLFEQAIFILKDDVSSRTEVTEDALLREARALIRDGATKKRGLFGYGITWALIGALLSCGGWILGLML